MILATAMLAAAVGVAPEPPIPAVQARGRVLLVRGRKDRRRKERQASLERVVDAALEWLAEHQSPNGSWDCDDFPKQCHVDEDERCSGGGEPLHDVGVTGLALMAFLGAGHAEENDEHADVVERATRWLMDQQKDDAGLIGAQLGYYFIYSHAIATLALAEAWSITGDETLAPTVERATGYLLKARNPKGVWRYDVPPIGDGDTSVTGWAVMALRTAEEAGAEVPADIWPFVLDYLDAVTDDEVGRVGYDTKGGQSARIPKLNDHFPTEGNEAMTAIGTLVRVLLGEDPAESDRLSRQGDLLASHVPVWEPDEFQGDMYYIYYGSLATYQVGGKPWRTWKNMIKKVVAKRPVKKGHAKGSWDPIGPWGFAGGRVYSTALMALTLQAHYRYSSYE